MAHPPLPTKHLRWHHTGNESQPQNAGLDSESYSHVSTANRRPLEGTLTRSGPRGEVPLELEEADAEPAGGPGKRLAGNRRAVGGTKYRHMLMIDAASDACLGKQSRQYAETAVVPAIMENAMKAQATKIAIQCSVCWKA